MSLTNVGAQQLLNAFLGRTSNFGTLANRVTHIGVSTTTPNAAGGNFTEPGGGVNYSRLNFSASDFGDASSADPSVIANTSAITFPTASGAGWGTISHIGFFRGSDQGTFPTPDLVLALDTARTINDSEALSFAVGELDITAT